MKRREFGNNIGAENARPVKKRKLDVCEGLEGRKSFNLEDFKTKHMIGFGCFSEVYCAKESNTGRLFAMKAINKGKISNKEGIKNLYNEKKCLQAMDCAFIIKLHATLQDADRCYFILDLAEFDFFEVLDQHSPFPESWVRFFASNVILALEHMHSKGIVYRDLKPENLMLTSNGYLRLVDFGFAKCLEKGQKTYSMGGTPEYMSPELISKTGHSFSTDLWSLGIFIFEMLMGVPPFRSDSLLLVARQIKRACVTFDIGATRKLSPDVKLVILGLLKKNASTRLQINALKSHTFFKDLDWNKISNQDRTLAPYIPPESRKNLPIHEEPYCNSRDTVICDDYRKHFEDF